MPRAGLSADAVVDVAFEIIDAEGPAAVLTLAAVAERAGVAAPSLYKHVRNLGELNRLVTLRVADELTALVTRAVLGRSRDDAVRSLMTAYRGYVLAHPGRYAAMAQSRDADPRLAAAADRLLDAILAVLRGYDLTGSRAIHAARVMRAASHGFAVLETVDGFGLPEDLETSYRLLVDTVVAGLPLAGSLLDPVPRPDYRPSSRPLRTP